MMPLKSHSITAMAYFFIAALLGLGLRFFTVMEIPITYKFFVHTHSHIALLGWVYIAVTTLIYKLHIQHGDNDKSYRIIFWCTQVTLVGMLLSFPFQGYALFSIIFSTSFLFASYAFFWMFIFRTRPEIKKTHSYKLMKAALWYMVLSSIGPWALGAIMNTLGPGSIWYRMAIYFYLHFQYNGWMILALVALFFFVMEKKKIVLSHAAFKRFFLLLNLGVIGSFFLSTLFAQPPLIFNVLGGLGAGLQLLAFILLAADYFSFKISFKEKFTIMETVLFRLVLFTLAVKMVIQVFSALPYAVSLTNSYLDFVIGYLHWTFLGVLTLGIFFFYEYFKFVVLKKNTLLLYVIGFVTTEVLIFYRAIAGWQGLSLFKGYSLALALASLLIVVSLALILMSTVLSSRKNQKRMV